MKKISLAHSPDADDIFMYAAIKYGWISSDFKYENDAKDIQSLNQDAINNIYDVCAISFALYPKIASEYALLRTATSFGNGYGPKLICLKNKQLKENFSVALSGEHTTNALLFRLAYPKAKIVYMNFLDIENAVLEQKVDAGVLIHESILNYDESLEVKKEIWDIWCEYCLKYEKEILPLPLGGMAIRRSLVLLDAIKIEKELMQAVKVATQNKKSLSAILLSKNEVRVNEKDLEKYLSLYANDDSICLNDKQKRALDLLFKLANSNVKCEENLLPLEYEELRNS
ncbi:menaquinone biosynthesis family protein [Campylobacter canadensis]|uniref:1,4-dihydroxy-6-naphtoate synthase n=1 Tax=Campylobacter canadensis TaxID=449520 RepID=A0ABS7WRT8_9BACT|nr:MqnA/MqnD/SBP family protein [Campylobacter canadensis]MBZ7986720.1 S-ribosylhomocysteine lyase [Campylobacter canadensis]MBZ7994591.1 S-ribosylhomocysteine lyase [Campylobacter canadensis]MBZ7996849.1 S-ribosylhomocysteine lyase [Campylobacter canadensis]MBZ7997756.1 S-ribosylhomocysteine lyase [Campylobacter canadensis]MBZ7999922.1 S-ribosylhomocysteine lyase [Campylobacter canadensis]